MINAARISAGILAAVSLFAAGSATAQAFGISEGTPISQLKVTEDLGDDHYVIEPPATNSEFESYVVIATPQNGVCKVTGLGRDYEGDRSGISVTNTFNSMARTLTQKYGTPEHEFDFLHAGSIWNESYEWAAAVSRSQRTKSTFWTRAASRLPQDINGIVLEVKASDSSTTYLRLSYEFSNFDACTEGSRNRDDSAL